MHDRQGSLVEGAILEPEPNCSSSCTSLSFLRLKRSSSDDDGFSAALAARATWTTSSMAHHGCRREPQIAAQTADGRPRTTDRADRADRRPQRCTPQRRTPQRRTPHPRPRCRPQRRPQRRLQTADRRRQRNGSADGSLTRRWCLCAKSLRAVRVGAASLDLQRR